MDILLRILLSIVVVTNICGFGALTIYSSVRDSAQSFSCPNCGKKFRLTWKQLIPGNLQRHFRKNYRIVRCPHCKKKDMCKCQSSEDI